MARTTDAAEMVGALVPKLLLARAAASPDALAARPFVSASKVAVLSLELSGFVPLVERLARRSALDDLASLIHTGLSELLGLLEEHGGDVVAFDGTVVVTAWPADDGDATEPLMACCWSGGRLTEWLHDRPVFPGVRLTLRMGVAAGEATLYGLGGEGGRCATALLGPAVWDAAIARRTARPGELVVSPDAWALVASGATGDLRQDGHVRLRDLRRRPAPRAPRRPRVPEGSAAALARFVPELLRPLAEGRSARPGEICSLTFVACRLPFAAGDPRAHEAVGVLQRLLAPRGAVISVEGSAADTVVRGITGLDVPRDDDAPWTLEVAMHAEEQLAALGIRCGIGVATSRGYSGPATGTFRRQHALVSRATLAASALCLGDAVLADEPTMRQSRGRILFDGAVAASASAEEEELTVEGPDGEATGFRPRRVVASATRTPLLGRDAVREGFARSLSGLGFQATGGVLVVEGEPGSGKTRLLHHVVELAAGAGMTVLHGSPTDVAAVIPYGALRRPLRRLFDLDETLEQGPWKARVLPSLEREGRWRRLAPLLAPLLGIDEGDNDITCQMKGVARAEATVDLVLELLRDAASRRPLVMVVDDVVDADSLSITILARVVKEIPRSLVVLALPVGGLPSRLETLLVAGRVERVVLAPLPHDVIATLRSALPGGATLSSEAARRVVEVARGNPLLARLATAVAIDETGMSGQPAPLPATIEGLVARHLAAASPGKRALAGAMAILGVAPLPVILGTVPDATIEALGTLVAEGWLEIRSVEPELSFGVASTVLGRAILATLPAPERAACSHRAAAAWEAFGGDVEHVAAVADLLAGAGEREAALVWAEEAAATYLESGASHEALDLLSEGARWARDLADLDHRARWERLLGEAHLALGDRPLGKKHLEEAVRVLGGTGTGGSVGEQLLNQIWKRVRGSTPAEAAAPGAAEGARASRLLARLAWDDRRTRDGLRHALAAVHLSESAPEGPERSLAYAAMTRAASLVPLHAVADSFATLARRSARDLRDLPALAEVLLETSVYGISRGDFVHVDADLALAAEIAEGLRDRVLEEEGLLLRAHVATAQGRFRDALVLWCLVSKNGAPAGTNELRHGWGVVGQASCLYALGRVEDAARLVEGVRTKPAVVRDAECRRAANGVAAQAGLRLGDPERARALVREALAASGDERSDTFASLVGHAAAADAALDLAADGVDKGGDGEDLTLAREACRGLRRFARRFPVGTARSLLAEGRRALLEDRVALAERRFSEAQAAASALGLVYEHALATSGLAMLLPERDPVRRAELARAWSALASLGAEIDLADLREAIEGGDAG